MSNLTDSSAAELGETPAARAGAKIQAWIESRDPTAIFVIAILVALYVLYVFLSTLFHCFYRRKPSYSSTNEGFHRLQDQLGRSTGTGIPETQQSAPLYESGAPYDAPGPHSTSSISKHASESVDLPKTDGIEHRAPTTHQSLAESRFADPTEHVLKRGPGSMAARKASIMKPLSLSRTSTSSTLATAGALGDDEVGMRKMEVEGDSSRTDEVTPNYLGLPSKVSEWGAGTVRAGGNLWRSLTTRREARAGGWGAVGAV